MSLILSKSVNFGSRKGGLTTVGYRLLNADGSVNLARTTSGITELIASTGLYGGIITFDDNFSGFVVWDTGQATPLYAMDQFDWRTISSAGGVAISHGVVGKGIWTEEEKNKVLRQVTKILKRVKERNNSDVKEAINKINQSIQNNRKVSSDILLSINKDILNLNEDNREKIKSFEENIKILGEALEVLLQYAEFKQIIKEVENHVETGTIKLENQKV